MAALLPRRVLVPLAIRSARYSSSSLSPPAGGSSSFSVLHNRLFSTSAAVEHHTLVRSIVEKCRSFPDVRALPRLPIPDGFPFTITDNVYALTFIRQDKDGKFRVKVGLKSHELINGDLCLPMYTSIRRGPWELQFNVIAGPKTLLIREARLSQVHGHKLWCFKEFLDSKGIDKGFIRSLLSLWENKDERIDA